MSVKRIGVLTSGGDTLYYTHYDAQTTEAAVRTWLNGKAGVSSSGGGGGGGSGQV